MRALLFLFTAFIMPVAFAQDETTGLFSAPITDKSLEYLGMLFGPMGTLPLGTGGGALVSQIAQIFNQVVFSLGIIIVAYTMMVSAINTAQEGEIMGKKWSTFWIPFRTACGLYLLLPTKYGYCWMQIGVMWFVLQGVGAADTIWSQVLDSTSRPGGGVNQSQPELKMAQQKATLASFLSARVCQMLVNESEPPYSDKYVILERTSDDTASWVLEGTKDAICGSVTFPTASGVTSADRELQNTLYFSAVANINSALEFHADEIVNTESSSNWILIPQLDFSEKQMLTAFDQVRNATTEEKKISVDDQFRVSKAQGWIHAGSYYFALTKKTDIAAPATLAAPNFSVGDIGSKFGVPAANRQNTYQIRTNEYFNQYSALDNLAPTPGGFPTGGAPDGEGTKDLKKVMKPLSDFLIKDVLVPLTETLSGGGKTQSDPLIAASQLGATFIQVTETILFVIVTISVALMAPAAIGSCLFSPGHVMEAIQGMLLPVVLFILGTIWVIGMTLAIYLPLVPYLVYTFGAIAWMMLVIEAVIAAPLVALVMLVPSEDEIGKAGHAAVIVFGLFLRPPLMVLGFVIASQLLTIAIEMMNYGFTMVVVTTLPNVGVFGVIAVLSLYTSFLMTIAHESFSVIYILPDKVIRWIGGHPEGDGGVMDKVKKSEGHAKKGAEIGKGMAKGGLAAGQKGADASKERRDEGEKKAAMGVGDGGGK